MKHMARPASLAAEQLAQRLRGVGIAHVQRVRYERIQDYGL